MNNKAEKLLDRVLAHYKKLGLVLSVYHPLITEISEYMEQLTSDSSCTWTVEDSTMNTDKYKVFRTSCNNVTGSKCIKGLALTTTCKYCNRLIKFEKEQKMKSFNYPIALPYCKDTFTVFFHEERKGVVISAGGDYTLGDYKEDWHMCNFRLPVTLTLEDYYRSNYCNRCTNKSYNTCTDCVTKSNFEPKLFKG